MNNVGQRDGGLKLTEQSLDEIGKRNGTDKSSTHHDYLNNYQAQIGLVPIPIHKMLEIGIFDGASLRTWHEFMPDTHIVGVDIDQRCEAFEAPNVSVEICDQSDISQLVKLAAKYGSFDMIIDDGSHIWSHQILTLETLFPILTPGGLYIIEDIDTSYGHYVSAYGHDSTISAAQYVMKLANYVLASTAVDLLQERDLRVRALVSMIESITLIRRSALIRRRL